MAAAGVLLVLWPRLSPRLLVTLPLLFAVGALRAHLAVSEFEATRMAFRDALGAPARCAAHARVVASPVWQGDSLRFRAELTRMDCEGRALPEGSVVVLYGGPGDLVRGDELDVVAQLAPVRLFINPDLADPTPGAARRGHVASGGILGATVVRRGWGLGALVDRARAHARRRIVATFAPDAVGMARALVLGETDLDPEDDAAFRKSGLSHLLAVSGTHLVFAVVALVRALRGVLARFPALALRIEVGRIAAALGVALSLVYADFAGGSGSAWRAAWMLAAAFVARALSRQPRGARVLGLSLLVGALVDPLAAFDISFLLSAAATVGLMTVGRPLAELAKRLRWRPLSWLGESVAATVSSMLPCAPLLALLSPSLTAAGIVANVMAAPLGEIAALPLCLAHPAVTWWPALERGIALSASGALLVVRRIAHASADAEAFAFAVPMPTAAELAVLAVGGVALFVLARRRAVVALAMAVALTPLELAARRHGAPKGVLRVTALDVGQGDSTLVDLPDGRLMLIDGGGFVGSPVDPGQSVILPLLRARRRSRVDVIVLSHPHPDHFGGLGSVLREIPVGELWDTGQGEREGAGPTYARLLQTARARHVALKRPTELCGTRTFGGAHLEVLSPCPTFSPGKHANDNSFVLRLGYGSRHVLLMGDAEADEESALLGGGVDVSADLLKVGHHGSRTSTSAALLSRVKPSVATISCGVRNRFGHPHAVTLQKLSAARVTLYRTDRRGGVVWRTDGDAAHVETARKSR